MRGVTEDLSKKDMDGAFEDRMEAAIQLADLLSDYSGSNAVVVVLPPGGVDIGVEVARMLFLRVDVLVVKEVVTPDDRKLVLGAMAPDDVMVADQTEGGVAAVPEDVYRQALEKARQAVAWREDQYRRDAGALDVGGRTVILVSDGIGRPTCMLAAVRYEKRKGAAKVVVAAATGTARGLEALRDMADDVRCVNVHYEGRFSIEAAFRNNRTMSEDEAALILRTLQ